MYRAKCVVDDLAPASNERIKTSGDYMLRRKQHAIYRKPQPLQLTCQNKVIKSSPSFDLLLNYAKGKNNSCACPVIVIPDQIAIGNYVQTNVAYACMWDYRSGKLVDITFQRTPGYFQTFLYGVSSVTQTIVGNQFNGGTPRPSIWNCQTGLLKNVTLQPPDNIGSPFLLSNISSNGKYMVGIFFITQFSGNGVIWNAVTGDVIERVLGGINDFTCVTNDGIVGGALNNNGRLWNGLTGELLATVFEPLVLGDFTTVLSISKDGQFIVGTSYSLVDTHFVVWDSSGQLLPVQMENSLQQIMQLRCISSDGLTIAGLLGDTICTWDRATGQLLPVKFEKPKNATNAAINGLS